MINVKKIQNFAFLLANVIILTFFAGIIPAKASFTPDAEVYSQGVYMVNLDTDITVFAKNENQRFYPASITKIMTALIALENVSDFNETVKVPSVVMDEFNTGDPNKTGPSHADIRIGQENLTYKDCLYALMLASACEAGNILAYNIGGGDMGRFMTMMNQKAAELGCTNTNFGNPHGLHQEDNYSSPYDMYLITKYLYDTYPEFMDICNSYQYKMPAHAYSEGEYYITTTNALITSTSSFYYEPANGIKTGSIDIYHNLITGENTEGHASFVSTAERGGYTYMLVTMGAPFYNTDGSGVRGNYHFKDHIALYKWAFDAIEYRTVLTKNDIIRTMPVLQGENADTVQLKPAEDFSTLMPKGIDDSAIQRVVHLSSETVNAPVQKGAVLGEVELKLADETLATVMLIAADDVTLSRVAHFTGKVKDVMSTTKFKVLAGLALALVIGVSVLNVTNKSKKPKNKKGNPNRRIKR